jgi:hypothetical protein
MCDVKYLSNLAQPNHYKRAEKIMTIEFYLKLKEYEQVGFLGRNQATKIYGAMVRNIRSPRTEYPPNLLETIEPDDPKYSLLPSSRWTKPNKVMITPEGIEIMRERINQGEVREIADKTRKDLNVIFNDLEG